MRLPSSPDPSVRYALSEANAAFVPRRRRGRPDPSSLLLLAGGILVALLYMVR